ncbi:LAO/AO transport system ATPase, variant 1 [Phytophthora nicotianae INRA-310]|uniref:LAO/AO transport system ATPase n=2 Tax=Phytophthora nicotianae (strain INRA-310) TaxID=761204 RepID=W2QHL8_PHYN3|nr:LAO/AO transport system ATPase [Phytophthora nicotianae INRA-310]XP_008902326.1 LAO/AO transport system ATPase, variant 1 [Phytophthora nicotianae INRA-310]ETN12345.1 LAO/AO transport system ATPase [Phytophthora nicotianae INRA-310]ETN12346.1 LAO/AO transport system ATPase, variant 1 [Phytophthora nicotianae INRA-310]
MRRGAIVTRCLLAPRSATCSERLLSVFAAPTREMRPMTQRLVEGVLQGNRTALSRSITLVESTLKSDEEQAELLLDSVLTQRRSLRPAHVDPPELTSFRLGIAGPPDPSSSRSGGSILGDKTRMEKLSNDPNAFVRPSPSRGTLGGVAQHTNEIVLLCESGGYDIILVESVGLGQSEIVIDDTVDMVMLLVSPAGGDDLQGQKKGIVEIADIVVVNKADGDLKGPAKHTAVDYMHAMHLMRRKDPDWEPKVKMISALEKKGIDNVWAIIEEYRKTMGELDKIAQKRNAQSSKWMWNQLNEQLMRSVSRSITVRHKAEKMKKDLVHGFISPRSAAATVLELFLKSQKEEPQA